MPAISAHPYAKTRTAPNREIEMPLLPLFAMIGAFVLIASTHRADAQQSKRGNETLRTYCTGDYLNFCGDLDPDSPATDACFKKNWVQLTENCRRAIDAYVPADEGHGDGQK